VLFAERARAESFGAVAERYDRARPTYPAALIDALLADAAEQVLDVGCGTGIAARLLADRGCRVLGVEVDPRMAQLARAKGLEVEIASFEEWQARGRRFDLVTAAQAWHWIEPHAGAMRAQDVLREGGRIALFWNFGELPEELHASLAAVYARLEPAIEKYSVVLGNRDGRTRAQESGIPGCEGFGEVEISRFAWRKAYDTASWVEHVSTHSDHQTLPAQRRERLLAGVAEAIEQIGGSFELPYETVLLSARRI